MSSGWDSDIKRFFVKIMNSVAFGLIWMLATATAGLYFELGYTNGKPLVYTIIFYICAAGSLALLIFYLYRTWRKE